LSLDGRVGRVGGRRLFGGSVFGRADGVQIRKEDPVR
jgi:hypothetical protein